MKKPIQKVAALFLSMTLLIPSTAMGQSKGTDAKGGAEQIHPKPGVIMKAEKDKAGQIAPIPMDPTGITMEPNSIIADPTDIPMDPTGIPASIDKTGNHEKKSTAFTTDVSMKDDNLKNTGGDRKEATLSTSTSKDKKIVSVAAIIPKVIGFSETIPLKNVMVGTSLADAKNQLPATILVDLSDGSKRNATLMWNNGSPTYNGSALGLYTFTGTLAPMAGVTIPRAYSKVRADIRVITEIISVTNPADVNVVYGTTADTALTLLPKTVSVSVYGFTAPRSLGVTWEGPNPAPYDGPAIGNTYTYTGKITLNATITNPENLSAQVSIKITNGNEDPNPGTALNINPGRVLYEFDSAADWMVSSTAAVSLDNNNFVSGTGSMKLEANAPVSLGNGQSYFSVQTSAPVLDSLTGLQNMEFNIFIADKLQMDYILVNYYTDPSNHSTFYQNAIGVWELSPGWNKIRRPLKDFTLYQTGVAAATSTGVETITSATIEGEEILTAVTVEGEKTLTAVTAAEETLTAAAIESSADGMGKSSTVKGITPDDKIKEQKQKLVQDVALFNKKWFEGYSTTNKNPAGLKKSDGSAVQIDKSIDHDIAKDDNGPLVNAMGIAAPGQDEISIAADSPSWASIDTVEIFVTSKVGSTPVMNFDKMAFNVTGSARVLFTFDDAWYDVLQYAEPILSAKGFKATTWANMEAAQDSNDIPVKGPLDVMDETQLKLLYSKGWDIGNHTVSHFDNVNLLTDAQLKSEYLDNQKWLLSKGWIRGAYHACYPSGSYNDRLISILKSIGVKTGRVTEYGITPTPVFNIYKLKTVFISRDTDVKAIYDQIDKATATGSTIIFMLHRVEKDPVYTDESEYNPLAVSTEKFSQIVDYVSNEANAGKLNVVTISQWYNQYMAMK